MNLLYYSNGKSFRPPEHIKVHYCVGLNLPEKLQSFFSERCDVMWWHAGCKCWNMWRVSHSLWLSFNTIRPGICITYIRWVREKTMLLLLYYVCTQVRVYNIDALALRITKSIYFHGKARAGRPQPLSTSSCRQARRAAASWYNRIQYRISSDLSLSNFAIIL